MLSKVNGKKGLNAVIIVLVILVAVTAVCFSLPSTLSKYVLTSTTVVPVTVYQTTSQTYMVEQNGINWLLDEFESTGEYNTTATKYTIKSYWKGQNRLTDGKSSLDSTGPNFGVPLCNQLVALYDLEDVNFSFSMYVTTNTVDGVKTYYMNVLFVNQFIRDMTAGDTVSDVLWYRVPITAGVAGTTSFTVDRTAAATARVSVTLTSTSVTGADGQTYITAKFNRYNGAY